MRPVSFLRTAPRARGETTAEEEAYTHPLSLDEHFIRNPASTFFIRAEYPSNLLKERGIAHGDILLVDRSITPESGNIILVTTDGDMELMEWSGAAARTRVYWGTVTGLMRTL